MTQQEYLNLQDELTRLRGDLARESARLDAVLGHAFEIVCKIPGGIRCVGSREDIDAVIAAYAAREGGTK
jgi:hypothetical protein